MMKSLSVAVALAWLVCMATATNYYSRASGRVLCRIANNFYPIKEASVMLMDKDLFKDDVFGSTTSDRNGYFFTPQGSVREFFSKPDPYIKVCYRYNGMYGQMEVNGLLKTVRDDRSRTKPFSNYISFGDIVFSGDHCRAYVKFYNAMEDYYNRTEEPFPVQPLHIRTRAILNLGTPYARIDTVSLPRRFQLTMTTAEVLLAHILRHSLDGNLAHLLRDAARFSYGRSLQCTTTTNPGRAFDEGWGKYWAGLCTERKYTDPHECNELDYNVVHNVAAGLRRLQMRCRLTYRQMVDILRQNPGRIHSFQEFEQASNCPEVPSTTIPESPPTTAPEPTSESPATTIPERMRPVRPSRRPPPILIPALLKLLESK